MDVVLLQHAAVSKLNRHIQRGLPAHSGKQSESPSIRHLRFNPEDLFHVRARDRLDVGAIGKLGIGHDGGWVRVHQHDFIALGL